MILLFIFIKNAVIQPKMVQIPKFWFLNLCTNICPSFGNIHSIKMVINNELTGEETLKTINFKPNFCIENHKKWNNSFFPPWTDLKSHIPWKLLTIRFFWCMACLWTWKFLLFGFLDSVVQVSNAFFTNIKLFVHYVICILFQARSTPSQMPTWKRGFS